MLKEKTLCFTTGSMYDISTKKDRTILSFHAEVENSVMTRLLVIASLC